MIPSFARETYENMTTLREVNEVQINSGHQIKIFTTKTKPREERRLT